MRILIGFSIAAFALAGCQTTGSTSSKRVVAVAGKPVKLTYYMSVNPDCTPIGMPTVRVLQNPQNGSVSVKDGTDFPHFGGNNIRSACNARRVASRQVWYTGNARGATDQVTTESIFPSGSARTSMFSIEVR